ncbi:uncharacterized protein LOC120918528 [Rana temporaria]|uniref:uncharacterized protein LOC120918528 n=1 Tax=Rana temporaria TaxID=8407 RepID=UPI001AAD88EF|nr:uncharacterized protein LOC120918528 [Rana temporaria]
MYTGNKMQQNIRDETSQVNHSEKKMLLKTFVCLLCSVTVALDSCLNNGSYLVKQEPKQLLLNPGETAIINCTLISAKEQKMKIFNFRKRFTKLMTIVANGTKYVNSATYRNRLKCSGQAPHFTLMLKNVTHDDSDFYLCDAIVGDFVDIIGEGTFIFVGKQEVTEKENETEEPNVNQASNSSKYIIISIIAGLLLLLLALFVFVRYYKTEKKNPNHNTYVDMTQTLRRNTMQNNNVYCHP